MSTICNTNNVQNLMIFPRECNYFYDSWHPQKFIFRNSLISYISKYPSSSKVYQKMIQSCKYFFIKNPIFVISHFCLNQLNNKQCEIRFKDKIIQLKNISAKLWITFEIQISKWTGDESCVTEIIPSLVFPKIYKCDIKQLSLFSQKISFKQFVYFSSNLEFIQFSCSFVSNDDDGKPVPLENLIKICSKLLCVEYYFKYAPPNIITLNTVQELLKIPHLTNLKKFQLHFLPEIFDIENFFVCIKENKKTDIMLSFDDEISDAFKIRVQAIVDEIVQAENHEYKVPKIRFPGNNIESSKKLGNLWIKTFSGY